MKSKWEATLEVCEGSAEKRKVLQSRDVGCMRLMWITIISEVNGEAGKEL